MSKNFRVTGSLGYDRYPISRYDYTYTVGSLLQDAVMEALGDNFKSNNIHKNGTDVISSSGDIGIEIWNWSQPHSYRDREESVITNLKPFKHRFLVTSFISATVRKRLENQNITVIKLGFQLVLKEWLPWYKKRKLDTGKLFAPEPISDRIVNAIKTKLTDILKLVRGLCIYSTVKGNVLTVKRNGFTFCGCEGSKGHEYSGVISSSFGEKEHNHFISSLVKLILCLFYRYVCKTSASKCLKKSCENCGLILFCYRSDLREIRLLEKLRGSKMSAECLVVKYYDNRG